MRKVLFKKWIPRETVSNGALHVTKSGTNCWSDFIYGGFFHQWANKYEDSGEGFGNYTVALVELFDGTIEEVLPVNIKFNE